MHLELVSHSPLATFFEDNFPCFNISFSLSVFPCCFPDQSASVHFPDSCVCVYVCVCTCTHTHTHSCLPLCPCGFASCSPVHVETPSAQLGSSKLPAVYTGVWLWGQCGLFPPVLTGLSGMHRLLQSRHSVCLCSVPQGGEYQRLGYTDALES